MISCGMVFIVGWATALSLPNISPSVTMFAVESKNR